MILKFLGVQKILGSIENLTQFFQVKVTMSARQMMVNHLKKL